MDNAEILGKSELEVLKKIMADLPPASEWERPSPEPGSPESAMAWEGDSEAWREEARIWNAKKVKNITLTLVKLSGSGDTELQKWVKGGVRQGTDIARALAFCVRGETRELAEMWSAVPGMLEVAGKNMALKVISEKDVTKIEAAVRDILDIIALEKPLLGGGRFLMGLLGELESWNLNMVSTLRPLARQGAEGAKEAFVEGLRVLTNPRMSRHKDIHLAALSCWLAGEWETVAKMDDRILGEIERVIKWESLSGAEELRTTIEAARLSKESKDMSKTGSSAVVKKRI